MDLVFRGACGRIRLLLIPVLVLLTGCGGSSTSTSTPTQAHRPAPASAPAPPSGTWTASLPVGADVVGENVYSELVWAQCDGSSNCYADGFRQQGSVFPQFLEHWDGTSWSSSDAPGGAPTRPTAPNELDCLPSGFCVVPLESNQLSIDSVVGGRWTPMPTDNPTSPTLADATVNAVACFSEARCLAAGVVGSSDKSQASALGLVWNGHRWKSTILSPQGADPVQVLSSVSCGSDSFCIAVGYTARGAADSATGHTALAARWHGSTWTPLAVPTGTRLTDIVCISPSSCLAVGAQGTRGLVLHWNGTTWTPEQTPPTRELFAVNCASEDLCMALQRPPASQPLGTVPVVLRWHGQWFKVAGYPAPAAYLSGVSCYPGGCLVVGQARSTPSTSANDVAHAEATAALYTIAAHGSTSTTAATTTTSTSPPAPTATAGAEVNHVTITGAVTATLTARPNECDTSGGVRTIQIMGSDANGANVVMTVTDQDGGHAQILGGGGSAYAFQGKGMLTVTATSASFTDVVMPDATGFGHGTKVTVNGTIAC